MAPSRAYQLVVSRTIDQIQFYITLRRISNSLELAKIDPDTGLQEVVGPSLKKVISASLQRNFSHGSIYISYVRPMRQTAKRESLFLGHHATFGTRSVL